MADCSCSQPARGAAAVGPLDDAFPVPAYPPSSWYTDKPDWLTPDTKIAVDDDGRVAGYFYHAGQCLVHDAAACPKPSPTRYAAFHQQEVVVEDGTAIRVGVIGNVNGHADPYARIDVAQAHYADPSRQLISCCAYDDEHGGYILGAMVPDATYRDVALVRRSALSGDWRPMPSAWWSGHAIAASVVRDCEGYDCIGPTLVTRPGLPLVRSYGRAAALGGLGGIQLEDGMEPSTTTVIVDGIEVTRTSSSSAVPPGPRPAVAASATDPALLAEQPAVTAASPDAPPSSTPPGGPPEAETPESDSAESERIDALETRVSQLEDAVTQLIDMVSQPMAASAELPEPELAAVAE